MISQRYPLSAIRCPPEPVAHFGRSRTAEGGWRSESVLLEEFGKHFLCDWGGNASSRRRLSEVAPGLDDDGDGYASVVFIGSNRSERNEPGMWRFPGDLSRSCLSRDPNSGDRSSSASAGDDYLFHHLCQN